MPECGSAVVCHWGRVSPAWRGQTPAHSMLLPTGGRIAAASWVDARRGADSLLPELLRNSCGSKSLLCRCLSSLCPVVSSSLGMVLLAPGLSVMWWWAAVSCALYQGCSFDEVRTAVLAQVGYEGSLALPWK